MRPHVRAFVAAACEAFRLEGPVYEFGALQVAGQRQLADLRGLFAGRPFVGCDMRPGPGVDRIEDLAALSLPDRAAGTVLCLDTLEHVFEVRRAVDEMLRVLAPGGAIVIAAPFEFRLHLFPDDYWRISPSCLERLLAPLAATIVGSQGTESSPHTVFGLGVRAPVPPDFPLRASNLCARFNASLARLSEARAWRGRLALLRARLLRSKGEYRRLRDYHQARLSVHFRSPGGGLAAGRGASAGRHPSDSVP